MLVLNREITLVLDDVSGRQTTSFNLTKISPSVTCGPCTLRTRKSLLLELLQKLQQVGRAHGSTARQVGIAWLLAQVPEIIPIPGTNPTVKWRKYGICTTAAVRPRTAGIQSPVEKVEIEGTQSQSTLPLK